MKRRLSHLLSITLLALFVLSGLASAILPILGPANITQTVSAAGTGTEYVLYYPNTNEFKSSLKAAFRDDPKINKDSTVNLLKQTKVIVRNADNGLGTLILTLDTRSTKENDLPEYKADYFCTPTSGGNMEKSLTTPDGSRPYVRYTYGLALDDNHAWGGITDDTKDTTYVGVMGNTNVGDVHFPAIVDTAHGGQPAKTFKIPGDGGDFDIRQHIKAGNPDEGHDDSYWAQDGTDKYSFQNATDDQGNPIPGASSIVGDAVAVMAACMPHPKGYMGDSQKTMNYWKLNAADKDIWDQAMKDANLGNDVESAATAADAGSDSGDTPGLDCKVSAFNPLTWLICPAVKGMVNIVGDLDDLINSLMTVGSPGQSDDPNQIFCNSASDATAKITCASYHTAWSSFRNIALGLIAVVGLIVVISQALGFEILDAYTIRKMLPRILIAAVSITLSWQLMQFFVTFTNDLGFGIRYLIYHPFTGLPNSSATLGGGGVFAASLIAGGAIAALGIFGVLSFAATAALAVFVAFVVLILRQMIIIILIIVAPVAIVAYVLPNTQKVYKIWWESFSKALFMFPIVAALIASGRVFALVSNTSTAFMSAHIPGFASVLSFQPLSVVGAGTGGSTVGQLIGFAAYFGPYFAMPMTLKLAGGAVAGIGGFVATRGNGAFGGLKKFRGNQYQSHGARKIEGAGRRVLSTRADVNSSMQRYASRADQPWLARKAVGMAGRQLAGYNLEAQQSGKRAAVAKELNDQIATGRDEEIRGLLIDKKSATEQNGMMRINTNADGTQTRQYKSLGGAWVDEAHVDAGQKRWGNDNFAKQAALSYEMRKASSDEDVSRIATNYGQVARATGMSQSQAAGAWMGAAYENQNQHLEYKYTNWQDGSMSADQSEKFAEEAYEKKGSYNMAQMHASTIESLSNAHTQAQAVLNNANSTQAQRDQAQKTQRQVAGVAETFVSRYGAGAAAGGDDDQVAAQLAAQQAGGAQPAIGGSTVTTNAPGAAHVAERVRQLAVQTGVYQTAQGQPDTRSTGAPADIDRQN